MGILGAADIMQIFDWVIIAYGAYTIYSAIMMKRTGMPGNWLMGQQEMSKEKDLRGFVEEIYGKTILFGAAAIVYGILSMLNRQLLSQRVLEFVVIFIFLGICFYYIAALNKAKKKFL